MGHVLPSLQSRPRLYNKSTIKTNGFKYRECVLVYVDDVLCISDKPELTMAGIQRKFKLKDDKIEEPSMYLGASLSRMISADNKSCWAMSSDEYCQAAVKNVEDVLTKDNLRLPSKCC